MNFWLKSAIILLFAASIYLPELGHAATQRQELKSIPPVNLVLKNISFIAQPLSLSCQATFPFHFTAEQLSLAGVPPVNFTAEQLSFIGPSPNQIKGRSR